MPTDDAPDRDGRVRPRLRRLLLDLTPLRVSRDYRLLWTGSFVSALGSQFARVGLYVQVFALTGSPAAVGLLGLSGLVGSVAGTFVGGSFIDAHDRRSVIVWTQVGHVVVAGVLVATALVPEPPIAVLHVANALTWLLAAINMPARQASVPRLVGDELMPQAVALSQMQFQVTGIVGPALAGVLIAATGPGWAYAVDLVSYAGMLIAAVAMKPLPPQVNEDLPSVGGRAVIEGFRYVVHHRLIQSTFVIDLVAMIFGMPAALFPVLAVSQFDRGEAVVGLLFAAPAVGALAQVLFSGSVTRIRHQGEAVIWAVAGWGAAIAAFGLVGSNLPLALLFLAIAGAADVVSAIFRSTILQVMVPDRLRGRLWGIFSLVVTGGPKLGDVEAGLVATWFTPTISVVTGGLACIAGAGVVAIAYPELRRYRADATPSDAA
ncbi:MAG TPA: MFS transporter [Actinomycetota bacterium]|nr:MFS transporter [Actinomycetota bacterium]